MSVPFRSKESALALLHRIRPTIEDQVPLSAMIEIADRCNEVCVHCYQVQGEKGELSTDDWRAVMRELADLGVLFLTVSGGEALLRRDALEVIAYARELKFAVKLYTNALRVDAEMADALADLAVQEVQISLYSPRAEVHDWVTGVPGSFDKVIEATRLLRARGVAVVLKTVLTSFNFDDRERYMALAMTLDADYMLDAQVDPRENGDRGPESFALTETQYLELMRDPRLAGSSKLSGERDLDRSLCGACATAIHVEANGQMQPCAMLDVDLGSALEHGVARVWKSDAADRVRGLTWRDVPGCRDCDLQPYCTRCFATAKHEGGDALAPYGGACERARLRYELTHEIQLRLPVEGGVGPFRLGDGGQLSLRPTEATAADAALRGKLGWTRGAATATPATRGPGQLVQIRRPGTKSVRTERVPSSSAIPAPTRAGKR